MKRVVEDLKEEIIYGIKSQEEEELDNRNEEVDESGAADDNEVADIMSNEIPHVEYDDDDDAPFDEVMYNFCMFIKITVVEVLEIFKMCKQDLDLTLILTYQEKYDVFLII